MSIASRGFGADSSVVSRGFGVSLVQQIIQKAINAIYFIRGSIITTFIEKTQSKVHKR